MDCNQIYDLLETLPPNVSIGGELVCARGTAQENLSGEDLLRIAEEDNQRYAIAYADLSFGWNWLKLVIKNDLEFTDTMRHIADPAIRRAYSHITQQHSDPYVMEAMQIALREERRYARMLLNALFLAKDYTLEAVCRHTRLDPISVAVYEKLFFNVVDRRLDSLWLASVVYPNTMLEEMFDNYMSAENSDFAKLMIRAGYKNGMADVLYFAGHPDGAGLLATAQAKETPERFESLIMAVGYIMARNGWVGQRFNATGFNNAKSLISAAKVGGKDTGSGMNSPFEGLGSSLSTALISAKRGETKTMIQERTELRITKDKEEAQRVY